MAKVTVKHEITVAENLDELSRKAADEFVLVAEKAVRTKGVFTVALSGGSTPKGLYTMLSGVQYRNQVPWSKVCLFWGDERCVPHDHPDSNYRMIRETLIERVPVPKENVYRMPIGQANHSLDAMEYEQTIRAFFHLNAGERPRFDLILLGMGEDGHTASLFPFTAALEEAGHLAFANYVEKLGAYRLTLTVPVINHAANVLFLVSGESKASVLKEVLQGEYQPQRLPSQFIRPINGRLLFMVDRMAASKLTGFQAERNCAG